MIRLLILLVFSMVDTLRQLSCFESLSVADYPWWRVQEICMARHLDTEHHRLCEIPSLPSGDSGNKKKFAMEMENHVFLTENESVIYKWAI